MPSPTELVVAIGEESHRVSVGPDGAVKIDDGQEVRVMAAERGEYHVTSGDETFTAYVATDQRVVWAFIEGVVYEFEVSPTGSPARQSARTRPEILGAPMPATVLKILVERGQKVEASDVLILLEAMKMELPLRAPRAGVIERIECKEGELVQPGTPLVELK